MRAAGCDAQMEYMILSFSRVCVAANKSRLLSSFSSRPTILERMLGLMLSELFTSNNLVVIILQPFA